MNAEIITVEESLLFGKNETINSFFIVDQLSSLNIDIRCNVIVGLDPSYVEDSFLSALGRSDIIIFIGGLGPEVFDITKKTIAKVLGKRLILDEALLLKLKEKFEAQGKSMPRQEEVKALVLRDSKLIENKIGTVSGFFIEYKNKIIISLPNHLNDLRSMMASSVVPTLKEISKQGLLLMRRSFKTWGLDLSKIEEKLFDLKKDPDGPNIRFFEGLDGVDIILELKFRKEDNIASQIFYKVEDEVKDRLGIFIYGSSLQPMEEVVAEMLKQSHLKLAVAESCSGGLLSHRLTNISGSSQYFEEGIVCYSNESKRLLLDIDPEVIKSKGVVSEEVARELALNIKRISKTDIGIGVTGIAGPTGGSSLKPVGLVYICVIFKDEIDCKRYIFGTTREEIKYKTTQAALDMIRRKLLVYACKGIK
ncbi:MAG: nicotinamide-nucleotide amidohydrolase family protein [bacterium]